MIFLISSNFSYQYYSKRIALILTNTFRNVSKASKLRIWVKIFISCVRNCQAQAQPQQQQEQKLCSWPFPFELESIQSHIQASSDESRRRREIVQGCRMRSTASRSSCLFPRIFKIGLRSSDTLIRVPSNLVMFLILTCVQS